MITVNPNPLMTQFLVRKTGVFKDNPFVIVDVGARGGLAPHWSVLEPYLKAYCFEPAADECARLAASAPAHITYIPKALAEKSGKKILYVTALADSSGLYKTNMRYFDRLVNGANGVTISEHEIECTTLADCVDRGEIALPDFIKIDAEGGEFDVMQGMGLVLPLGFITEIRFHGHINGSAPFSVVDNLTTAIGYRLYDLTFYYQSRKDLPYPQLRRVTTQEGRPFMGVTTRGQIQDGDALYFRDLVSDELTATRSTAQILKMACLMELYSLNDCAAELLIALQKKHFVEGGIDFLTIPGLLNLLASGITGERTTFEDYRAQYFS